MKYRITGTSERYREGDIAYEFRGHDYGCTRDDIYYTGEDHLCLTLNEDGSGPFFTVPVRHVEVIESVN